MAAIEVTELVLEATAADVSGEDVTLAGLGANMAIDGTVRAYLHRTGDPLVGVDAGGDFAVVGGGYNHLSVTEFGITLTGEVRDYCENVGLCY